MNPATRVSVLRAAAVAGGLLVLVQLALLAAQVHRERAEVRRLAPVAVALDSLASLVHDTDRWLEVNQRLVQQYGQPGRYAARLRDRATWATAHRALTEAYNRHLRQVATRPRWLLFPAPAPRLREHLPPLPPGGARPPGG